MDFTLLRMIAKKHKDARSVIESLDCHFASDSSGFTLLHHSAKFGNEDVIEYLLERACDVDVQDEMGRTPLMLGVIGNHEAVVRTLILAGADIDVLNSKNESALYLALSRHEISIGILTSFLTAVKEQFLTNISRVKKIDDDFYSSQLAFIKKAIFYAQCRNTAIVEYMLFRDFPVDSRCPDDNQTLLHVAVTFGHLKIVKQLLERGADPNALDIHGQIPLYHLYFHDSENTSEKLEILRALLSSGASLTPCTSNGTFQITSTLIKGDREVIREILESNLDLASKDDFDGMHVLHYLVLNTNPGVIEELELHVKKLDINAVDNSGRNALFGAVMAGNVNMVKFLLENDSDVNLVNFTSGFPALFYAYTRSSTDLKDQHDQCAEFLLRYNADPQFVVSKDNQEVTIFDLVLNSKNSKRLKLVIAHLAMLERSGIPITEIIRTKIDERRSLKIYFERCQRVLGRHITDSLTVNQLLTNSKPKMSRCIDDTLIRKFERLSMKTKVKLAFPYYYCTAEKCYMKGKEYQEASFVICQIFRGRIDRGNLITQGIMYYLDQQSLKTLSQCYKLYV